MLKAKEERVYSFSQSKASRDMAVAAVMSALGLTGLIPGKLPKSWSRVWGQKQFVPFADWPSGGETYENTYAPQPL